MKRGDANTGALTFVLVIGGIGAGVGTTATSFFRGLPWEVPAAIFLILLFYGVCRASYEELLGVERDKGRVEAEKDELKEKLETYEGRDASEVVVDKEYKAPNGGAVLGNHAGDESGIVTLLFSGNAPRGYDTPAASIEVNGPEDTHVVAVRYEVRGGGRYQFQPYKTIRTETHLQVLDESGKVVMYPTIYTGMANVAEDEYWRYTVSRSYALSGLARGTYDLRVFDYASGRGGRNYYDMRLVVTKLAKSAASPVAEG